MHVSQSYFQRVSDAVFHVVYAAGLFSYHNRLGSVLRGRMEEGFWGLVMVVVVVVVVGSWIDGKGE